MESQGGNKYIEINVITEWRAEMRNQNIHVFRVIGVICTSWHETAASIARDAEIM